MRSTLILGLGTLLPKAATFITLPILTGCLTKEEYGVYDLAVVLMALFLPAVTLQMQAAAFRFLIDKREDQEGQSAIVTNVFGFIAAVSLVALIVFFIVSMEYALELRFMLCVIFFLDALSGAAGQCARGMGDNRSYSTAAVSAALVSMLICVVCVFFLGMGIVGCLLMLGGQALTSLIVLSLRCRLYAYIRFRLLNWSLIKELLSYSWPLVPNSLSAWVIRLSNRLIIALSMGVAANAAFAVAYKIPQLLQLVQGTFNMAWQENASIAAKDEDSAAYYSSMFETMFRLIAGFMAILLALTPLLFSILVRGSYDEAYVHIPILFLGFFFQCMSAYLGGIYVARKRTKSVGVTTIVAAIVNLVINIVAIPRFGLYGASVGVLLSYSLLCAYRMVDIGRTENLAYDIPRLAIILAIVGVMCAMCAIQDPALNVVNGILSVPFFIAVNRRIVGSALSWLRRRF